MTVLADGGGGGRLVKCAHGKVSIKLFLHLDEICAILFLLLLANFLVTIHLTKLRNILLSSTVFYLATPHPLLGYTTIYLATPHPVTLPFFIATHLTCYATPCSGYATYST